MPNAERRWTGIDLPKDTLDLYVWPREAKRTIPNAETRLRCLGSHVPPQLTITEFYGPGLRG